CNGDWVMTSKMILRSLLGTAGTMVILASVVADAAAQSSLPPVTVDSPGARTAIRQQRATTSAPRSRGAVRARQDNRAVTAPPQAVPGNTARGVESAQGPVQGYVANRTLSGTKTNTPIREIPQSISVVGAEQIQDQKPQSFDQILRYTPGVSGEVFGADTRNDWFMLRGFRAQQDAMFLDGMPLFNTAFATWKLQPFALERVEVLRGPSSVLYGGGNPGGVVNAVSKMPTAEPIRYIETGVNSFGNGYVAFDVGERFLLPPGAGTLDGRVVGMVKGGGTQVDFTQDNSYFLAPSFTYRPDFDTRFTVLALASKDRSNGNNWLPYEGSVTNAPFGKIPTKLFQSEPGQDYFMRGQTMIGYQFEKDFSNGLTFRQNARYAHVDTNINSYIGNGYDGPSANATLARYHFMTNGSADLGTIDNQLEGRFNTGPVSHKVLVGVDYKKYRLDDYQATGFPAGSLSIFNPAYGFANAVGAPYLNRLLDQGQLGVYVQDQMKIDRFTLVLSGRNDWVDTQQIDRRGVDPERSRDSSKATGRAGLIYDLGWGLSPYVSYATGFNPVIGTTSTGQFFTPEEAKQVEAGAKWEPAGFNGYITGAWFDLRKTNALTVDPNNIFFQVQNGEVTSRGFELSMTTNLTPEFKMVGSVSSYDLFISQDVNAALLGKRPVAMPTKLASLWGDYTFRTGWLAGFGFGGGVRHIGDSFADQANTLAVPSRTLFDAAIHYEYQQWRAALNVTNVADKIFVSSCDGITSCFYGERRKALLSLGYRW
ncbi:MAG: TonB-dependent siderophore receptor, partial [Bradyrhizobium sp.]